MISVKRLFLALGAWAFAVLSASVAQAVQAGQAGDSVSTAPATGSWFRIALLMILWMFIAAVLVGPIERHFSQRRHASGPPPRAW
jgi:hypothetical protein